jgi:uncharacterized repeat protein (TIGR03803 family)
MAAPRETVLYGFDGGSVGNKPDGPLTMGPDGALYGTTASGGYSSNGGTVFRLAPPGNHRGDWTLTTLYSFCATDPCLDGGGPNGGLVVGPDGSLYGTTSGGGTGIYPEGTVFKLTPPRWGKTAWTQTVLYSFCATTNCADGMNPEAGLLRDRAGALYGTTLQGNMNYNTGVVFKLTPPANGNATWTESVLYQFCSQSTPQAECADGVAPRAALISDGQGALYGTTTAGGPGVGAAGTVFKLTPPAQGQSAWTETTLYGFTSVAGPVGICDGAYPSAGVVFDRHGALYGTTSEGGFCNTSFGSGTVFKLTPPSTATGAWTETLLHIFCEGTTCSDGYLPQGVVVGRNGALYGVTNAGGNTTQMTDGAGLVFELTAPRPGQSGWTETVLYEFTGAADSAYPNSQLLLDRRGILYGTTYFGGSSAIVAGGGGTVFSLDPCDSWTWRR